MRETNRVHCDIRQGRTESFISTEANLRADEFPVQWQRAQNLLGTFNHFETDAVPGEQADFVSHKILFLSLRAFGKQSPNARGDCFAPWSRYPARFVRGTRSSAARNDKLCQQLLNIMLLQEIDDTARLGDLQHEIR